jgi:DNA-binding transcriptional LysR family regulator
VPTFATRWLIPRLPLLVAQHPDITVHIETRTRPFMFGETPFDAALYAGTPEQVRNWAGTKATLLMMEEVVPVCSPKLMNDTVELTSEAISLLPLLQQSTRAEGWRQWFEAQGVDAPLALAGPRYELFSMTAAAATHGMGVALVPRLLVETELARGELVIACNRPLRGERGYYIVTPEHTDKAAEQAALSTFVEWLKAQKSAMLD